MSESRLASLDIVAADASLQTICSFLTDELVAERIEPGIVRLNSLDLDGFSVAFLPLEGRHPSHLLLGAEVPDDWDTLGVLATGTAFDHESHDQKGPAFLSTMVSRRGELAHAARYPGGVAIDGEGPVVGHIIDLLRCALRLPTDPPPCSTATFFAVIWLTGILNLTERVAEPTWDDVVACHTAVEMLDLHDVLSPAERNDVVRVARALANVCDWTTLRALLDAGKMPWTGLDAGDGAWFDDGAFARWLLADCVPLRMLRDRVEKRLPTSVWRKLRRALNRLDVPARTWPDVM